MIVFHDLHGFCEECRLRGGTTRRSARSSCFPCPEPIPRSNSSGDVVKEAKLKRKSELGNNQGIVHALLLLQTEHKTSTAINPRPTGRRRPLARFVSLRCITYPLRAELIPSSNRPWALPPFLYSSVGTAGT